MQCTVLPVTDPDAKVARRRMCIRAPGFLIIRRTASAPRLLSADSEQPTQQRRQDARRADQDYFHGTHLPFGEPTTAYAAQAGKVPGKCCSGTRDNTPDAPHRLQLCVARRCPEPACSLPTAPQTHPGPGTGGWRAEPAGGCGVRQRLPGASDAGCGGFPALAPPCPPSDAPEYRYG